MQYVSTITGVASQAKSLDPFKMTLVVNIVLYTPFTSQGQFRGASIVINNDQLDTSWVPRTRAAAKVSDMIRQLPSIALKDITSSYIRRTSGHPPESCLRPQQTLFVASLASTFCSSVIFVDANIQTRSERFLARIGTNMKLRPMRGLNCNHGRILRTARFAPLNFWLLRDNAQTFEHHSFNYLSLTALWAVKD
jgi:hypothetical protein